MQKHHRVIIVGAGPGGVQLGYFLGREGVDYLIVERGSSAGEFFKTFPVLRTLLSINKVHTGMDDPSVNLRWDWNSLISDGMEMTFKDYDQSYFPKAESLLRYLSDFCDRFQVRVRFGCEVLLIDRQQQRFNLRVSDSETLTCDILVVATGTPLPYVPAIPGIEACERYDRYTRAGIAGQDVLIIGKGNSAFETANDLLPLAARIHLISPEKLKFAWQSHFPGHLRQINSAFWETFTMKQQNAVLNGSIHSVRRSEGRFLVQVSWTENGQQVTLSYDRVILCAGFMFDTTPFLGSAMPVLAHGGKLPALTACWESVNVPGMFFCGALMQANDYKRAASSFIHGMRYNGSTLGKFIMRRLGAEMRTGVRVEADPKVLLERIYSRIQQSSSLWHMHDSLCDAYVLDDKGKTFVEMRDMPVRYMAEESEFAMSPRIEFRFTFRNPEGDPERGKFTNFGLLHPILLLFIGDQLIDSCHMYEDIYAEWPRDKFGFVFDRALQEYVERALGEATRGRGMAATNVLTVASQ